MPSADLKRLQKRTQAASTTTAAPASAVTYRVHCDVVWADVIVRITGLSRIADGRTAFQFERLAQLQNRVRLLTNAMRQV